MSQITYKRLEQNYLNSAIGLIIENKILEGGILPADIGVNEQITRLQDLFDDIPEIFESSIIAVDTNKPDYVCGIIIGFDFSHILSILKIQGTTEKERLQKNIHQKLFEPIIKANYQTGELLYGSRIGVRKGYEYQNISQNISSIFGENGNLLGYTQGICAVSNPKSGHLISNISIYSRFKIIKNQDQDQLNAKYRLKYKDMFIFGQMIDNSKYLKLPPVAEQPRL